MSDRNTPLAGRAFGEMLDRIESRVSMIERRNTWPASIIAQATSVEEPSDDWVSLSATVDDDPPPPPADTFQHMASITVPQGRWVLTAHASHDSLCLNGGFEASFALWTQISNDGAEVWLDRSVAAIGPLTPSLFIESRRYFTLPLLLEQPTEFQISVAATTYGAASSMGWYLGQFTFTGFPG